MMEKNTHANEEVQEILIQLHQIIRRKFEDERFSERHVVQGGEHEIYQ